MTRLTWTAEMDALMRQLYPGGGSQAVIDALHGRLTVEQVNGRATRLGLQVDKTVAREQRVARSRANWAKRRVAVFRPRWLGVRRKRVVVAIPDALWIALHRPWRAPRNGEAEV